MKAVITGASGDIGAAIARAFAKRGDILALFYNSGEEAVKALAAEVAAYGVMVVLKKADLTDAERHSAPPSRSVIRPVGSMARPARRTSMITPPDSASPMQVPTVTMSPSAAAEEARL